MSSYFSLYPNGAAQPPVAFTPVTKRLILNVETDLGIEPDNLEGMAFGPALPDGRVPLILMSDNNFAASSPPSSSSWRLSWHRSDRFLALIIT